MSDSMARGTGHVESCGVCEDDTAHEVRIEFRVESRKRKNAEFSREPYRVAVCGRCGESTVTRMNDA